MGGSWRGHGMRRELRRSYEVGLWKSIWVGSQALHEWVNWKVGREDKIFFQYDAWLGTRRLKVQFPHTFNIVRCKNMLIKDVYEGDISRRVWLIKMTRNLNYWELEEYEGLLAQLTLLPS